jgi:SAM-dependent methyltransferase
LRGDAIRWEVLKEFKRLSTPLLSSIQTVIVVGGGSIDPEIVHLESIGRNFQISYVGIDKQADLVCCSQVLEHIWNHQTFFNHLKNLTKPEGYLWINVPFSNFVHGSPHFYSSGFSPDYLVQNLEKIGFEIVYANQLGSRRYYLATHILNVWLTEKEHKSISTYYHFQPGTKLGIVRKFIRELIQRVPLAFFSASVTPNLKTATESLVFARRRG